MPIVLAVLLHAPLVVTIPVASHIPMIPAGVIGIAGCPSIGAASIMAVVPHTTSGPK